MSEAAIALGDNISPSDRKHRRRDKEKARVFMAPYMTQYRADHKIAAPLGLTVGQWRKQQRDVSK